MKRNRYTYKAFLKHSKKDQNEPRREKTNVFAYAITKTQISFAVTAKLISAFVFTSWIVQYLFFLSTKGGALAGARDRGFDAHSCHRVVSLSKTYLPPKSTGNTHEAVAPSKHD